MAVYSYEEDVLHVGTLLVEGQNLPSISEIINLTTNHTDIKEGWRFTYASKKTKTFVFSERLNIFTVFANTSPPVHIMVVILLEMRGGNTCCFLKRRK